jgi:hypothetical protein
LKELTVMKIFLPIATIAAAGLLSACSSSNVEQDNLEGVISSVSALGDNGENFLAVEVDDLPDSANLNGFLAAGIGNSSSIFVGNASATADFNTGTLTGSADNFTEFETSAACGDSLADCTGTALQNIDGSLDITGDITGTNFTYNTSGVLSGNDVEGGNISADIDMDGAGAFGTVDGNLTALGVSEGSATLTSAAGSEVTDASGILILEE